MKGSKPLVIAHRGFSGKYPENSTIAFEKAIEVKSDMIELDVHLSKDNKLVVTHDFNFGRTVSAKGNILNYNLEQLVQFGCGSWKDRAFNDQKIPSLGEVLKKFGEFIAFNIEVKRETLLSDELYDVMSDQLLNEIDRYNLYHNTVISSFDKRALEVLRHKKEQLELGLLDKRPDENLDDSIDFLEKNKCYSYHPNVEYFSHEHIAKLKDRAFKIFTYTANKEEQWKRLVNSKIDGIITDWPDKLRSYIKDLS